MASIDGSINIHHRLKMKIRPRYGALLYADWLLRELGEGRHINDEPIFHVAFQHPLIGRVDVIHGDDLNVRHDIVLGAEVQHFLCFADAPNERPGQLAAFENQVKDGG